MEHEDKLSRKIEGGLVLKNESLLKECANIIKRISLPRREINLIVEWQKQYSREEIVEAVKKAVSKKARVPISGYSSKILAENRFKFNHDKQQILEIKALESRIREREKRYE